MISFPCVSGVSASHENTPPPRESDFREGAGSNIGGLIMRKTVFTFPVGEVRMTTNAARNLDHEDMLVAFQRHTERDWRGCCKEDAEANERALREGGRLLSVHKDRNEIKFWIITESDRSATTILLPEDY
jgi:hypothetical protein